MSTVYVALGIVFKSLTHLGGNRRLSRSDRHALGDGPVQTEEAPRGRATRPTG